MNSTGVFLDDYRRYLTDAYEERHLRNPQYSMRAFSRDLGMGVSTLTELLKGKYGLSKARVAQVTQVLQLNNEQALHFADLVTSEHARNPEIRAQALLRVQERLRRSVQTITLDSFKIIADWYHFALLELFALTEFENSPRWMAKRLGLSELVVREALERLERLDLIEHTKDGYRPTDDFSAIGGETPSQAIRRLHKQILEKAIAAIDVQSMEAREYSSTIFAVDRKDLPAAKKRLLQFRREFAGQFSKSDSKNDVYCLGIQFFSLTTKGK